MRSSSLRHPLPSNERIDQRVIPCLNEENSEMIHLHDILGMKISDYELERRRIETLFQVIKFYIPEGYGERLTTYKDLAEAPFSPQDYAARQ